MQWTMTKLTTNSSLTTEMYIREFSMLRQFKFIDKEKKWKQIQIRRSEGAFAVTLLTMKMLLHLLKITWCLLPFTKYQRRQATIICKHFKILMQDIFIYSLVVPQPNANLCQGHSFTHPILITAYSDFYLKFNRKLLIRYVHEC